MMFSFLEGTLIIQFNFQVMNTFELSSDDVRCSALNGGEKRGGGQDRKMRLMMIIVVTKVGASWLPEGGTKHMNRLDNMKHRDLEGKTKHTNKTKYMNRWRQTQQTNSAVWFKYRNKLENYVDWFVVQRRSA